jgi:cephalosporin hydroxylase
MLAPAIDIPRSLLSVGAQQNGDMIKLAEDLNRYIHVIRADDPEVVIECGTWHGGSARWFASMGLDVITIDSVPHPAAQGGSRITWLTGNSVDPALAERVAGLIAGRRTMVVLDSDHSADHVVAEIKLYGPLVTPGCHLVVEDGIVRWMANHAGFCGSPLDAIERCLPLDAAFERDEATEAMFPISMYPCGWWIRRASDAQAGIEKLTQSLDAAVYL